MASWTEVYALRRGSGYEPWNGPASPMPTSNSGALIRADQICLYFLHGCCFDVEIGCQRVHPVRGARSKGNAITFGDACYSGPEPEDLPAHLIAPRCWAHERKRFCPQGSTCFFEHIGGDSAGTRLLQRLQRNREAKLACDRPVQLIENVFRALNDPKPSLNDVHAQLGMERRRLTALFRLLRCSSAVAAIAFELHLSPPAATWNSPGPFYALARRQNTQWHLLMLVRASRAFREAFTPHLYALAFFRNRPQLEIASRRLSDALIQICLIGPIRASLIARFLHRHEAKAVLTTLSIDLTPALESRATLFTAVQEYTSLISVRIVGPLCGFAWPDLVSVLRHWHSLRHLHLLHLIAPSDGYPLNGAGRRRVRIAGFDDTPAPVLRLPMLRNLTLGYIRGDASGLLSLFAPTLERLTIREAADTVVSAFVPPLPCLSDLVVERSGNGLDVLKALVGDKMPSLRKLEISGCEERVSIALALAVQVRDVVIV